MIQHKRSSLNFWFSISSCYLSLAISKILTKWTREDINKDETSHQHQNVKPALK